MGRAAPPVLALGLLVVPSVVLADVPTKQECVAANESAQELRREGKLRETRAQLSVCISASCPGPVREDCVARLAETEAAVPSVVFDVRDDTDRDLSAVRVTMDGQPLADRLDGGAIAVDPGPHHFVFEAQRFRTETRDLVLREGVKNRRERVVLVAEAPATPTGGVGASATSSAVGEAPGEQGHHDGSTQRTVGLALGGAGALGVVVGGIFGIVSKITYDHARSSECGSAARYPNAKQCSTAGVADVQAANGQATVSTVGFIAGAVLLGAGAFVYLTAPKAGDVAVGPAVGSEGAGLVARGRW